MALRREERERAGRQWRTALYLLEASLQRSTEGVACSRACAEHAVQMHAPPIFWSTTENVDLQLETKEPPSVASTAG